MDSKKTIDKNKDFLEELKKFGAENLIFKPEGLGALEFDITVTGKDFETKARSFRIERISTQSFLRIADIPGEIQQATEVLKKFVAYPIEARDIEFYNLDLDAMTNLVQIIMNFQQTPSLFIKHFKK